MDKLKLPQLDEHGNLPPGIHDTNIDEVEELFGCFQASERRQKLMQKLKEYVGEIKNANWNATVIIDGSFVMSRVDEPGDIDVVLVLPPAWDMAADVRPFEYNLLAKKPVRKRFGFDLFPVRHGSDEFASWTEFFMQVNPKWNDLLEIPIESRKGLVRIVA